MSLSPKFQLNISKITLDEGRNNIYVVDEVKLLGQILTTDMKTLKNTRNMCRNAYARMHVLRRLSSLGCPRSELLDVLRQQVLSMVEQAVPFWAPLITKVESNMIERVFKTGLKILFRSEYISFNHCLRLANMKSLKDHRKDILFKFCKQAEKHPIFSNWFTRNQNTRVTRTEKPIYKPVVSRTTRFARSTIPVATLALNWHPPKVFIAPSIH